MSKTKESKLEEEIERLMLKKGIWQLARYQAQSNQNGLPDRLYLSASSASENIQI